MINRSHWKVLLLGVLASLGVAGFVFACGSDNGSGPEACQGPSCDGGGAETSTTDGPGSDSNMVADGGSEADADASIPVGCGEGGAGTLDPTFGDGGLVWLKYPGAQGFSIAVQADGKILVGGGTSPRKFALVRLLADGTPDPTWGLNGLVETKIVATYNEPYRAIAIQADGKIVAVGAADTESNNRSYDFTVVRYNPDGGLDPKFGDGGAAMTDFGAANFTADYPTSVALLADGRIVVGGFSTTGAPSSDNYAVARYKADGTPDGTFGNSGKVTLDLNPGTADYGGGVAIDSVGKILISGLTASGSGLSPSEMSAVRLNDDGSVDTNFAGGGIFLSNFGGAQTNTAGLTAIDPTGRILLGGYVGAADLAVLRLTASGTLDPSFGDGGVALTNFAGRTSAGTSLLQSAGGLILAGTSGVGAQPDTAIIAARYQPNGSLDSTFGTGGTLLTLPPPKTSLQGSAGALDSCAFLVVGTWSYDNDTISKNAMGIARYRR